MCGEMIRLGTFHTSELGGIGSSAKTSRIAPAIFSDFRISKRAG